MMSKSSGWILMTILGLGLFPTITQAAYFEASDHVELRDDVASDAYLAGDRVRTSGQIEDDLFAAGDQVTVEGVIGGDALLAGKTVMVKGEIRDDIVVAGESVTVSTDVEDVMVGGGTITIGTDTTVIENVYVAGGEIRIEGVVTGDVYVAGQRIIIGSSARIAGDLRTAGVEEPTVEEGAVIEGERHHESQRGVFSKESVETILVAWTRSVVAWSLLALLWFLLARPVAQEIVRVSLADYWRALLYGAGWLLLLVPLVVTLAVTLIGVPLALMLVALSVVVLLVSIVQSMLLVGSIILTRIFKREEAMRWQHVLLGVFVYALLWLLPLIGEVVLFLLLLLSVGSTLIVLRRVVKTPLATVRDSKKL